MINEIGALENCWNQHAGFPTLALIVLTSGSESACPITVLFPLVLNHSLTFFVTVSLPFEVISLVHAGYGNFPI